MRALKVFVNIKQIGQRRQRVAPVPFELERVPETVGELITQTVTTCVAEYNRRVQNGENAVQLLSGEQINDMSQIGKIAFGLNYSGKQQDLQKAVDNALQAFNDGLYRVFLNDTELKSESENISLRQGDTLTFIRLTMLAGRLF